MFLWRVSNHSTLDGRGGVSASARWHSEGRRIVYLAESPAGALVEVLVHLELNPGRLPAFYRLLKAEAPDDISTATIGRPNLPENWMHDEIATRTLGDEWLTGKGTALCRVPSAIAPETFNMLLNPEHQDASHVSVLWHEQYPWDARLLQ